MEDNVIGSTARWYARIVIGPYVEMSVLLSFINIIEKRRWKCLGRVIRKLETPSIFVYS